MDVLVILKTDFTKWLKITGYADSTIYTSQRHVHELCSWLKRKGIYSSENLNKETITKYINHLKTRKSKKRAGSLSQNYIQGQLNSLKRLSTFLSHTESTTLEIPKQDRQTTTSGITILNRKEIQSLYASCSNTLLGTRDRAMLSIYYGCGLRKSEGLNLTLDDINLKERLIYIKKTKTHNDRYVPMSPRVVEDLHSYIYYAREKLISSNAKPSRILLISQRAKPLCRNGLTERLSKLKKHAGITKQAGLHTLRHSIASHLLESGMSLLQVSRFLGHKSLESTQIYTHLINQ